MKQNRFFWVLLALLLGLLMAGCAAETLENPAECAEWYSINKSDAGRQRCARGIVKRGWYVQEQNTFYLFFSGNIREFYLAFPGQKIEEDLTGTCIAVSGRVQKNDEGAPFMVPDELMPCPQEAQVIPTPAGETVLPIAAADFDLSECLDWQEVNLDTTGQEICLTGTAWTTYFEDDEYGGFFYIEFGGGIEDVYIAVDGADLTGIEGHCVVTRGMVEIEENTGIPYLWITPEELFHCDP